LFEQHRGGIDLVLCDAVLPDQSGALLVEMFRREAPQLKVILCSGYPQGDLPPHGPVIAAAYFMTKPYSAHSLLAKIRDAFQEKAEDEKPGPGLTLAVSRQHRSALIRRPSKDDTRRYVTRG
jgi:DNA-binding NtrC family response regulator